MLKTRPAKAHDLRSEAAAFMGLAATTIADPRAALQAAADFAIRATGAGSAGISLVDTDDSGMEIFRWTTMSGPLADHLGGTVAREFSPCGLCLDAGHTIAVTQPSDAFAYFDFAARPLLEGLIVPLYGAGRHALGTLWVVHHEPDGYFDADDVRVMEHLAAQVALALKLSDAQATTAAAGWTIASGGANTDVEQNPLVRKLDRFVPLSTADRVALSRLCAGARVFDAGTDLLCEGDTPDAAYVVMEGYACQYKLRSDGARQITNYLLPGDACEIDVPLGAMNYSIGTLSACKVARVPHDVLAEVTNKHPTIARALRMSSLIDESTLREWLMNIGRRSAEERIAHLFCEILTRMQAVGLVQDNSFRLPLTQFDLGDTIGLSYVHVNRTLQALRQQGLIVLRGKMLTVLNVQGLKTLAEFKPTYLVATAS